MPEPLSMPHALKPQNLQILIPRLIYIPLEPLL
jgi:hypothetical protein